MTSYNTFRLKSLSHASGPKHHKFSEAFCGESLHDTKQKTHKLTGQVGTFLKDMPSDKADNSLERSDELLNRYQLAARCDSQMATALCTNLEWGMKTSGQASQKKDERAFQSKKVAAKVAEKVTAEAEDDLAKTYPPLKRVLSLFFKAEALPVTNQFKNAHHA